MSLFATTPKVTAEPKPAADKAIATKVFKVFIAKLPLHLYITNEGGKIEKIEEMGEKITTKGATACGG